MNATLTQKIETANNATVPSEAKFKYIDECGSVYNKLGLTNTEKVDQACLFVENTLGFPIVTPNEIATMLGLRFPRVRTHGQREAVRVYREQSAQRQVPNAHPSLGLGDSKYDEMMQATRRLYTNLYAETPRDDRSIHPYKLGRGFQGRPVSKLRLPVPKGIALRMEAICQCNLPEFFFMAWGPSKVFAPLPRKAVIDPVITLAIPLAGLAEAAAGENPPIEHFLIGKW